MSRKRVAIAITLAIGLLAAGCAESTVRVRRDDSTYRTSAHLVLHPGFADRSFSSGADYMLSTEFNHVTYVWPKGKGSLSKKLNEIHFEGKNITCSVVERRLTINGRPSGEFEEGDRVRITADGKVFVNDVEQKAPGDL